MSRTQDEILARIREAESKTSSDVFGFGREVLLGTLDFEHAKGYLEDDATAERWDEARTTDVEQDAREYLAFAIVKILGHRGISASRSVSKLTEYAWLLGRDDVMKAIEAAGYAQYGAPKVKAFAEGMGWPWPGEGVGKHAAAQLARMAKGDDCTPDGCYDGCRE